jgi:hypothetical protein
MLGVEECKQVAEVAKQVAGERPRQVARGAKPLAEVVL